MLQYLDFSQASTSRKWTHKRQGDGFEAPRNSMELPSEASHSYGVFQEDVPYSCHLRHYPRASLNRGATPIKKLIDEDMSSRTNNEGGHKRPSVIARLMGMDTLPPEIELISHVEGRKDERTLPRRDPAEVISTKHVSFVHHKDDKPAGRKDCIKAASVTKNTSPKQEIFFSDDKRKEPEWTKPQAREHPQEEELQKFKKEFEAWQATRLWEHSRNLELENGVQDKNTQIVRYKHQNGGKDDDNMDHIPTSRVKGHARTAKQEGKNKESMSISGSHTFSVKSADTSLTQLPVSKFHHEEERSLSPTRIVILKPCPEMSSEDVEESSVASPELIKKENNMEAFLEEVKKRLRIELEGRTCEEKAARWSVSDMASGERSADPKQIARSIANQIRETVTKDFHSTLVRSESTRSYRSDIPLNGGQNQTDFIGRDARKQLSDRLKNVLRRETDTEVSFSHRRRAASMSFEEDARLKHTHDMARKAKTRSKQEKKSLIESDATSFRHKHHQSSAPPDSEAASPRNLIRSFSAPVSGTTFVKLLSEEPRVLTGARIQRKHEAYGNKPSEERKCRKDAFNIKGRVSNLRQNFGLRGKLFGKKLHSTDESLPDEFPPIGRLVTAPSVLIHPGILQENSTEVPPSPASWCSSPPDEMSRGGYPSPVSPLEASFSEHHSSLQTIKEMSSSPLEPGNLSEQVQTDGVREAKPETNPGQDDTTELESPTKAYVRTVLVIAGLYEGQPFDQFFSRWDMKPIPKWVFEEVEETSPSSCQCDATIVNHRLLFDLINEALPRVVQASTTFCTFKKWFLGPKRVPNGKKLLDGLWNWTQMSLDSPRDVSSSMDGLIGRDLSMSSWSGTMHEDIDVLGREMESEILEELVDEMVWDVLLNVGD